MSSDQAARDTGRGLAGLIDVLDRADGALPSPRSRPQRPVPHRTAAYRTAGHRAGGTRAVPLRPVPPAPAARPAPGGSAVRGPATPAPAAPERPRPGLLRRLALWGSGPDGAYLAWDAAPPHRTGPRSVDRAASGHGPRSAGRGLRGLVRRLAMWGAGPDGAHLAWGPGVPAGPARGPAPARPADVDPPVVLRELPSTPTVEPAASSPAAALPSPRPGASTPRAGAPGGRVPSSGVRPAGAPSTGLVRARGDPVTCPARGSPSWSVPGRAPPAPG